ncbi:MAG TPA: homocysteine S-methyltransferase family protein [Acidobacteriota bacterium]|nr:homocysteine S-methyltransferase family protein [Acidobacteriota bacterium]
MDMENIVKRLQRGDVIVGDGAIGTMLIKQGLKQGDPPELYNLTKPHLLEEIASLYLNAGAEIISTNTFGASPLRLRHFSLDKKLEAINRNAVEAVRKAVGNRAYISASIGPSARFIKPFGDTEPEEVADGFRRQIQALLTAGIDMLCIETMTDVAEAMLAIEAARSLDSVIPIMTTMTFSKIPQGYFTMTGTSVSDAAARLAGAGADIVGSNCGNGTAEMVEIAREFKRCTKTPLAIQCNAGLPTAINAELVYPETPGYMADKTAEMLDIGVQIIGGCCGTEPEHIAAIRKVVDKRRQSSTAERFADNISAAGDDRRQ